jgi:sporulation protein YlmC with PRC-barrel domain
MRIPSSALLLALLAILVLALVVTLVGQIRLQAAPAPGGTPPAGALSGAVTANATPVLVGPATAPAAAGTGTPGSPRKLLTASTLSQFTVTNEQGMLLGQVENALVDLPTGQVQYAFLMFGRDPAMANLFFAVPFAALDLNRQGQGFILHGDLNDYQSQVPLSRQVLALTPVLPRDFHRVFGARSGSGGQPATPLPGVTPIPTVGPAQGPLVLIPQLIGSPLRNGQGQSLGLIQDFPIDPKQRVIRWAVVVPGDPASANKKLVPVPLAALRLDAAAKTMLLDVDPATVWVAPGFGQDNWPDTYIPGWDAPFVAYWQRQGILTQR